MKETILYGHDDEPEAISVDLEDVKTLLIGIDPSLSIQINYDDYDDYGVEHFLTIKGECADLVFKKDYGGMYCQTNCLECFVQPHSIRGNTSFLSAYFDFLGEAPRSVTISADYETTVSAFFESHKKYLKGDNTLFSRTEQVFLMTCAGIISLEVTNHLFHQSYWIPRNSIQNQKTSGTQSIAIFNFFLQKRPMFYQLPSLVKNVMAMIFQTLKK